MKSNTFRQKLEIAKQHLETLQQQKSPLPEQEGPFDEALQGLSGALEWLQEAHSELSRQNKECMALCRSLEAERAYYRDIFEHAPHARLLTDLSGTIQTANALASSLLGIPWDSLDGQRLAALLSEQDNEDCDDHLAQLQSGQEVCDWEVHLMPGTGEPVPVSLDAVPIHSSEHQIIGFQWLLRDLRRQMLAEQALRKREQTFRSFLEQSQDGIALTDERGRVLEWNRAMERITGLAAEAVVGQPIWDVQFQLDAEAERTRLRYERSKAGIVDLLRSGHAPWSERLFEREYVHPDGTRRVLEGDVFPIKSDQGFLLGSITRDITERRRAEEERERLLGEATHERQRAEQLARTLAEERNTFQVVVESTHTQIAYLDPRFNFLFVNSAYARGSGHAREELIGRNHFELFPNAENQVIFEEVRDTGQPARFSARPFEYADRPERGVTYWDWSLVPVKSKTGEILGLVLSLLDVTQQVETRLRIEALSAQAQQQASELTAMLNAIPGAVAVWDAQGTVLRANPAAVALGIAPAGSQATFVAEQLVVCYPDGRAIPSQELPVVRALHGETILNEAEILVTTAGEEREITVSAAPIFSRGEIVSVVVASYDTTEQRRVERERERLLAENRAQREFLERLLEAAPVGVAVLRGPDHRYELANPYYRGIIGVPETPMIGRTIVEVIPDLPKRGMLPLMDQVYRTGQTVSTREVQLSFGPGREETYLNTDRVPLRGPDGAVEGILVLAREVTHEVQNRRRIEDLSAQAQRQADEMAAVFAALIEPLMAFDAQGAILSANPAAVEALGFDPVGLSEVVLGQKMSVCYSDGRPIPAGDLVAARALRGEKVRDEYQRLVNAHGDEQAIVASAAPIVTAGQVSGAVVTWHDITELRRAEVALRDSEEKLRTLFELMPIGISILDEERRIANQNAALTRILGLPRERLLLEKHLSRACLRSDGTIMPPDELPSARAWQEQRLVHDQVGIVKEDGTVVWTDMSAAPVPFADWKVVIATMDVTELKRTEEALRRARDELQLRVRERTAELEHSNQALLAEIRERTRVEGELRQSEQRLEQRVTERTRELATLLDISNTVALTIDLEPLLALILERLKDVVDYNGGAAFRLEAGTLNPVFHRGAIPPDDLLHIGSHLEEAALGHAVILGSEPMILADVQGNSTLQEAFRQAVGAKFEEMAKAVRAWMAVPVTIKQQVYGVLYVYHNQPGRYAEEQARLALPFGNQAAVAIENARLYEQAQKLAAVEERQHLARELHDAVSQTLFSASLAADVLPRLWERDREAGLRCLSEVHQLTRGALAEMRMLLLELRPAALVESELGALLRQLSEAVSSRARIPVTVRSASHYHLPPEVQVALYRIAQEALNNAAKHAEAQHVQVDLQCIPTDPCADRSLHSMAAELCVADDGRGFDAAHLPPGGKGLGLNIMRERAEAAGAALHVESRPGQGTRVTFIWPAGEKNVTGGQPHD